MKFQKITEKPNLNEKQVKGQACTGSCWEKVWSHKTSGVSGCWSTYGMTARGALF